MYLRKTVAETARSICILQHIQDQLIILQRTRPSFFDGRKHFRFLALNARGLFILLRIEPVTASPGSA